jgi:Ca-activated chloride channel family protein
MPTTGTAMTTTTHDESCGGYLVATDGRALPLARAELTADARGGVARAVLVQVFRNVHPEPLQVTYQFPLPHGGAVSGFAFRLGGTRIVGEVDLLRKARERFEEAIVEGRTAALLEQQRTSVFTQEIGNVPPGAVVEAELTIDQRLDWRDGGWEWRFPTALAPRYQGAPGRVPDAGRTAVAVADGPLAPRLSVSLSVRDALAPGKRPESPSHEMSFTAAGGLLRAALAAEEGAPLDRDVVIRWPVAAPEVGLSLDLHRPAGGRLDRRAFGLLTVVPPAPEARPEPLPRDLIALLDTSGSMSGEPLEQARRVVGTLVDSLGPRDRLELVAFSSSVQRWRRRPAEATEANREDARRWLAKLSAGGGTEMREGIREALRGLRPDAQRQVVLVTDGLIGFEQEVVAEVLAALPPGSRLHTVGVGSGVNRSLTGPAARAGRGLEVVIGLGEDPERAAFALRARTAAPIVTGLEIEGSALVAHAPARLPDLFAGAPALASLELRPEGGALVVRGRTAAGAFERRIGVPPAAPGEGSAALAALHGRERVEDLEMRLAAGEPEEEVDRAVEGIGMAFQISTRLTSWVAVSEARTVDPTEPVRRERMPQQLPHGMSAEGLGLRSAASFGAAPMAAPAALEMMAPPPALERARAAAPEPPADKRRGKSWVAGLVRSKPAGATPPPARAQATRSESVDEEAPGRGSPGEDGQLPERRLAATLRRAGRGRAVLEVEVTEAELGWEPPTAVTLRLEDGTEREVEVDLAATTAGAALAAGQVFRLVLRLPAEIAADRVAEVSVVHGATRLALDVRH